MFLLESLNRIYMGTEYMQRQGGIMTYLGRMKYKVINWKWITLASSTD